MLRMSKKMFYAVEAVLYIAYNETYAPISSKEIAKRQGLPARYLEQIMQHLVRSGILHGIRGPKGGYALGKEKEDITVAEICDVIKDMDKAEEDTFRRTALGAEVTIPLCKNVDEIVEGLLKEVSIASMCETATELRIPKGFDDFVI